MYTFFHSRPERRPRVGRICDKDLKCIMPFIVGRIASAARRPRVGRMRPILASDRSDRSDASAACGWRNGSETLEIPLQYDSVTSFDDAADA